MPAYFPVHINNERYLVDDPSIGFLQLINIIFPDIKYPHQTEGYSVSYVVDAEPSQAMVLGDCVRMDRARNYHYTVTAPS